VLVGIVENINELLDEHQSLDRCLKQVKMPKMKKDECLEIITSGMKKLEINISPTISQKIVDVSSGYPYPVHLICYSGVLKIIKNNKNEFLQEYFRLAINKAIKTSSESLKMHM